jgi:hypothetical protein
VVTHSILLDSVYVPVFVMARKVLKRRCTYYLADRNRDIILNHDGERT